MAPAANKMLNQLSRTHLVTKHFTGTKATFHRRSVMFDGLSRVGERQADV